jgi:hypothetical protein
LGVPESASPTRLAIISSEIVFEAKEGQREIEEGQKLQQQIVAMLEAIAGPEVDLSRPEFEKRFAVAARNMKISSPLKKAILIAMSERDDAAEICVAVNGSPEPDSELRDYENFAAEGRHSRVLRARGEAARTGCVD